MRKLALSLFFFISVCSFAQNTKIKELEQQRKNTLLEISNTDKLLKETKANTNNLLNRINLISNQIFSRQKVLGLLEQEISGISTEQTQIESEIAILEIELKAKQKNYAKAVEGMLANRQQDNRILFLLSGKSIAESYRRMQYLRDYSQWRSDQSKEIKEKSTRLLERKSALVKAKQEKSVLLAHRVGEQENLKKEETNFQQEVEQAKKQQGSLQKILTQKRQQARDLDRQIERLIAEEVARQEREARRIAEEKARADAAKGKTSSSTASTAKTNKTEKVVATTARAVSPENLKLSSDFASNKGRLPYPITGNYTIVTRYGTHQHSTWVQMSSSGIDIQSQSGANAIAVFNGEVSYVAAIPGYNTCIIIRHGNYFTFYGNLQNITVKLGDKVKTGQTLGRVYTDADTGFSQMHFQLWQGTTKMNPTPWLR